VEKLLEPALDELPPVAVVPVVACPDAFVVPEVATTVFEWPGRARLT
jgi:hypothetical protein